jgi:NAD dependent epimerase/dehydratase family enzyme
MMFGEMGENLLLKGCRVVPKRLQELGYEFKFPNLEDAFRHILKS